MTQKKTIPSQKPRNFVAKNATTGGAGAHKDKKKAQKQGDQKHKDNYLDAMRESLTKTLHAISEDAYSDGVTDGMRGQENPRASSIYGPETNAYHSGFAAGVEKARKQSQIKVTNPYENTPTAELEKMKAANQKWFTDTQQLYQNSNPSKQNEIRADLQQQGALKNKEWNAINAELSRRKQQGLAEGSEIKVPTEDGIGWQDIRLLAGEGKLTQKTIQQAINIIRKQRKEQGVAEGQIDEIDYADTLDSSAMTPNKLMQSGKVIGNIEGNDVVMLSKGNQTVYMLKVDDQATAFVGFKGKHLKNIKNFTKTPGVIRALIGYLVHKQNMKLIVSPNEPLTSEGLKWVTRLINDPRGLVITDHSGKEIDPDHLNQEWQTAKKTGTPGTTGIRISENIQFGNKIRENESKRSTNSLLMPFNFYSVSTKKQGVAEAGNVSHLHKALDRALSKEKKASPAQVEKNKARWAQRQARTSEGRKFTEMEIAIMEGGGSLDESQPLRKQKLKESYTDWLHNVLDEIVASKKK